MSITDQRCLGRLFERSAVSWCRDVLDGGHSGLKEQYRKDREAWKGMAQGKMRRQHWVCFEVGKLGLENGDE